MLLSDTRTVSQSFFNHELVTYVTHQPPPFYLLFYRLDDDETTFTVQKDLHKFERVSFVEGFPYKGSKKKKKKKKKENKTLMKFSRGGTEYLRSFVLRATMDTEDSSRRNNVENLREIRGILLVHALQSSAV